MRLNMLRREFVRGLGRTGLLFAAIPSLLHTRNISAESNSAPALSQQELEVLADLAYQLVPLLQPWSPVYQAVAASVQKQSSQNPAFVAMISAGIVGLTENYDRPWLERTQEQRVTVLQSAYPDQFLALIRWITCEHVLRDEQVWEKLGYQGSSIEYGGYLHSGFDDIDWLPDPSKRSAP